MKSKLTAAILALAFLLALTGCNAAPEPATPSETPQATATESFADESDTPTQGDEPKTAQDVRPMPQPSVTDDAAEPQPTIATPPRPETVTYYETEFRVKQTEVLSVDMDGDGRADSLEVRYFRYASEFYEDYGGEYFDLLGVSVNGGEEQLVDVTMAYLPLHEARLDAHGGTQLYIEEIGWSADYATTILRYDGKNVEYTGVPGLLQSFDGDGKIVTDANFLVAQTRVQTSYFMYYEGEMDLVSLPKAEMLGAEITYDSAFPLVAAPMEYPSVAVVMGDYYSDDRDATRDDIESSGGSLVCFLEAGERAEIVDVDATAYALYPWIKLRTPSGSEGWICVVDGD